MPFATSSLVNSLGLVLDIVGVLVIWRFGLPTSSSRAGHVYLVTGLVDEVEKAKAAKYDLLSKTGLGFVLFGFVFQLASNFIKSTSCIWL